MNITFKEFGTENGKRTATLTIEHDDGTTEDVTRSIPDVFEGTIQDYLKALANGLRIEFAPKVITTIEEEVEAGLEL